MKCGVVALFLLLGLSPAIACAQQQSLGKAEDITKKHLEKVLQSFPQHERYGEEIGKEIVKDGTAGQVMGQEAAKEHPWAMFGNPNSDQKLRGTGVALVTPFKNGAIDWEDLERIIEHVIAGGVEFLVSLGTTGESSTTTDAEHRQILDFAIKVNRGRVPFVAGVFGGNNTAAMVEKIQGFNFDGIDALLSSNPAYNRPGQEGIFQHYLALAEASPLPIIIYNVPSRTSSNMTAETTLRLAHSSEKFIAVKEASDDIYQVMKILKGRPENFLVLSGDDFITLPLIAVGGDGVISVIANTLPRQFTDMVRAALRQDLPTAQKLNFKLLELYKILFAEGNPVGVKAAMELQGLCSREVRLPLVPMTENGVHAIMAELEKLEG